jgi:hypothetical protein
MRDPGRKTLLAAALAATALLPGCPSATWACKTLGLCSRDRLEEPPATIPPDFEFVLKVDNQVQPPIDYLLKIDRSGKGTYKVVWREPRREVLEGDFEIVESRMTRLWDLIREIRYPELETRYPDSGEGKDRGGGIARFMVKYLDFPQEVQCWYVQQPDLEKLRMLAISYVPETVIQRVTRDTPTSTTGQVIGDVQTRMFYAPGSPLLKDVPENRRQVFPNWYEALNYGYQPGADWRTPREGDQ